MPLSLFIFPVHLVPFPFLFVTCPLSLAPCPASPPIPKYRIVPNKLTFFLCCMKLSPRESEILFLIVGMELSNSAIALKLGISTGTVDTHRKKLLQKMRVKNSVGLTKMAIKEKYISV